MPAPNIVSFLDPSLATDQADLDRRMQLAQMLQQQALQPPEAQQGMKVQPKVSPFQAIAKVLQGYMAGKMNEDNAKARGDLSAKSMQALAMALGGAPQGSTNPYQSSGMGNMGGAEDQQPTSQPAPQQAPQPASPFNMQNAIKIGAMNQLSPELAAVMAKELGTPDAIKQMDLTGQNRMDMGRLGRAAEVKKGILELQPGTTALNLDTGAERFQPKVGEGVNLQGGQASPVPGYAPANAAIAGAQAQATEAAKMIDVPIGNGKTVKMTQGQYLQLKEGGQPSPQVADIAAAGIPMQATGNPGQVANLSQVGNNATIGVSGDPSEQAGRSELAKTMAADVIGNLKDSYAKANGAVEMKPAVDALKTAIDSGKLITGPLSGTRLTVAQIGNALGYKGGDESLAQTQQAVKSMASFALGARSLLKGSGAISDFEQRTLSKASSGDLSFTVPELKALVGVTERARTANLANHSNLMDRLPDDPAINQYKKMYQVNNPSSVMKFDAQGNLLK